MLVLRVEVALGLHQVDQVQQHRFGFGNDVEEQDRVTGRNLVGLDALDLIFLDQLQAFNQNVSLFDQIVDAVNYVVNEIFCVVDYVLKPIPHCARSSASLYAAAAAASS